MTLGRVIGTIVATRKDPRMAEGCKDKPVDASIVGIVDTVSFNRS